MTTTIDTPTEQQIEAALSCDLDDKTQEFEFIQNFGRTPGEVVQTALRELRSEIRRAKEATLAPAMAGEYPAGSGRMGYPRCVLPPLRIVPDQPDPMTPAQLDAGLAQARRLIREGVGYRFAGEIVPFAEEFRALALAALDRVASEWRMARVFIEAGAVERRDGEGVPHA